MHSEIGIKRNPQVFDFNSSTLKFYCKLNFGVQIVQFFGFTRLSR